jgi:hypothetical protein
MQSPATLQQELRLDFSSIVPEFVRTAGHGTVIVLLGNDPSQDTILGDPDRQVESNVDAIVKYINCRFWDLQDIEITVDVVMSSEKIRWPAADAPKSGGGRPGSWATLQPLGMLKSTINRETKNSRLVHSGTVPLAHGLVQADWYLREGEPAPHARAQNNVDRSGLVLINRDHRTIAHHVNDLRDAVDRMRYGMGQLMDYGVRYRAELAGAKPMLVFGRAPASDAGWIADVLQANGVAFVCGEANNLIPLNDGARRTRLFAG